MRRAVSIVALLFAFFFSGCNKQTPTSQDASSKNRRVYQLRGVVKEIISPTKAKIQHEAIPGYMEAMTMDFDVKKTNELARIKVGDQIKADMVVTEDDGWLENIVRTGEEPVAVTGDTNQGISFSKSRDLELSVGDPIPDYAFVNEDGKKIRFSDFKGQALGITFIFTRCPFPTFCPRMTSNFEKVAADLAKLLVMRGQNVGNGQRVK